ncbi:hypothetical protein PISL3812_05594 [Talaromyces islandicus]|uniref:NB-ARC domain-containing protein n=1 Tax=Talaromyces islandicus TaxID=28573 RepID=A0A0U1LZ08_TALIS|nr:hypothetical protein PISL3812_05594 [Talaromyces islandicus]
MSLTADRTRVDLASFYNGLVGLGEEENMKARIKMNIPLDKTCSIPFARNSEFFGRESELEELGRFLGESVMSSVAIHGDSDYGKTQLALEYAWRKAHEFDVVLWLSAESEMAIHQSLTYAATKALGLKDADPIRHDKNAVLVMQWLKTTGLKWLLIYDNVKDHVVFHRYWPVSKKGSVIFTTRDREFATEEADHRILLRGFDRTDGPKFLIHCLRHRENSGTEEKEEFRKAEYISTRLNGMPVLIIMAAFTILHRGLSLKQFLIECDERPKPTHRLLLRNWLGGNHFDRLDVIWDMFFEALGETPTRMLIYLSLLGAGSLPQGVVHPRYPPIEPDCYHPINVNDLESLAKCALVRIHPERQIISIPKVVQEEWSSYLARRDGAKIPPTILDVGFAAFEAESEDSQKENSEIYAHLLDPKAEQLIRDGDFGACKEIYNNNRKFIHTRKEVTRRMGVAAGSACNHYAAADIFKRAEDLYSEDPHQSEPQGLTFMVHLQVNKAQNAYCQGRFEYAAKLLDEALKLADRVEVCESWKVRIHSTYLSLGILSGDLDLVEKHLDLAAEAIQMIGWDYDLQLTGQYCYIVGCAKYHQGEPLESMLFLNKAATIENIIKAPTTVHQRTIYVSSRAYDAGVTKYGWDFTPAVYVPQDATDYDIQLSLEYR